MNIKKLRKVLQKIISDEDVFGHAKKIEKLCSEFGCSIRVLSEYDPKSRENFNCFEYALGLNANVHIAVLSNSADLGAPVDYQFIDYLVELGDLREIEESRIGDNDLVIYFLNSKAQHAGRWNNGRVTSKWDRGLLYNHEIYVTPVKYGEPRYFSGVQSALAKKRFIEYARKKGISEEYLLDA